MKNMRDIISKLEESYGDAEDRANELQDIKNEIGELMYTAIGLVDEDDRGARSYWYAHILAALGSEEYSGQSMHSMQDSIDMLLNSSSMGD